MITIQKNRKPKLKACEMICDKELNPKLNKYELTKFLNSHTTNLLIGKPRSGKTSLLYSLFQTSKCLKKCFHNIYLFQPSHSRGSMKDKLFDKLPDDQKFEELDYEGLAEVMDRIKVSDPDHNNCIIFDDCTAALKDYDVQKLLKELVFNRRHLRTSIYFLCQTYISVPKDLRKLFSNLFIFRTNKVEMKLIFEEQIEDKDKINLISEITKLVFDKPYQFLFINTDTQRFFKNFDELIFKDDDDIMSA